ncbi:MAG: hypothetical protein ABI746_04415 [Dermatophilaceae bacterium]
MSTFRLGGPRRHGPSTTRLRALAANASPVLDRTLGTGRGRRIVDETARRLGLRTDSAPDVTGWSAPEYLALRASPPGADPPPRREGSATAALANRLAGELPTEAVVLARAITDVAPVAGRPVGATMHDILDRYLAESLLAYDAHAAGAVRARSADLLLGQLETLFEAAERVHRAEAEHSSRELQIQERFLAERFREPTESALTLPDGQPTGRPLTPHTTEAVHSRTTRSTQRLPSSLSGRTHLEPDRDSAALLIPAGSKRSRLSTRLALPKGQSARLGAVVEYQSGAVVFRHVVNRRWLRPRQVTGFRAPQANLTLVVDVTAVRRVLVYCWSPAVAEPRPTTLFASDGGSRRVTLSTLLAQEPRASVTAIASAYATASGVVLRNESTLYPNLRAACEAYGYDRTAWLDVDTPVV